MKTPLQYKNLINELDLDQIKTENIDPADVKQSISHLMEIQNQLKNTEISLNMDIHALRSQYQGRIKSLSINPHHKPRVEEEQRVQDERDAKLAPYEEVKNQIQTLIEETSKRLAMLEKNQA